jgi:hypothetical protein
MRNGNGKKSYLEVDIIFEERRTMGCQDSFGIIKDLVSFLLLSRKLRLADCGTFAATLFFGLFGWRHIIKFIVINSTRLSLYQNSQHCSSSKAISSRLESIITVTCWEAALRYLSLTRRNKKSAPNMTPRKDENKIATKYKSVTRKFRRDVKFNERQY